MKIIKHSILTVCLFNLTILSAKSIHISDSKKINRNFTDSTLKVSPLNQYTKLVFKKKETITSAGGTKSVLFNSKGTRLYALNLEGMSICEFDQGSRKLLRNFKFSPTEGKGWDYKTNKEINSFQEKPVEASFSHGDSILWVSLHNAEGITPIWVDNLHKNSGVAKGVKTKLITILYSDSKKRDSMRVPLIETGKTPKIITTTIDSKYLLVSNWHSHTTSVLELNKEHYPFGKVIKNINVSAIPRGMVIDNKIGKSYIAIMGGSLLKVVNNANWQIEKDINVLSNPRHIVMDNDSRIYISHNNLNTLTCVDSRTGKKLFSTKTHAQPRTIVLSKNQKFVFVSCYSSDYLDVYKINDDSFELVTSLPCSGHPVGVDIYEDEKIIEAWVCSYTSGAISIFTFDKK